MGIPLPFLTWSEAQLILDFYLKLLWMSYLETGENRAIKLYQLGWKWIYEMADLGIVGYPDLDHIVNSVVTSVLASSPEKGENIKTDYQKMT